MKMTRMLAILGAVAAVAAADAQAQWEFEVVPFGGGTFFLADPPSQFALERASGSDLILGDASFDPAWTLGVNAGVRLNEMWGIEAMFSWLPTRVSAASGLTGDRDVNAYMYGLTGLFYIPVRGPVTPFVGLGVGAESFDYRIAGVETHHDLMGNVVGGLYIDLADRVGLRLEARDCVARFESNVSGVDSAWENDLMTSVGLSFRFPR